MIRYIIICLCTLAPIVNACAEKKETAKVLDTKAAKTQTTKDVIKRGDAIEVNTQYLTLDEISDAPEKFSGKEVCVKGEVTAVCKAKGCWMTMAGKKITSRARVTFKDYAFFVPMDVKGKKVRLKGEVKVKMLSDAERAHLAEDGKVAVSEIPKAELRLVASGVEIHP